LKILSRSTLGCRWRVGYWELYWKCWRSVDVKVMWNMVVQYDSMKSVDSKWDHRFWC